MNMEIIIFMQLLLAHILTDFVLQPSSWIRQKRQHKTKSRHLYVHALLAGLLTYVFLQDWSGWIVPVFISITHFFIDLWKLNSHKDNLRIFLLDQFFHFIIIVLAWLYLVEGFAHIGRYLESLGNSPKLLAILVGYLLVIFPAGFVIGKATERWQSEIESISGEMSLKAAGRYIGIFERVLVLTFILMGNFSAIGFLIAAKSILRFGDKSNSGARKQTEYVLIGTLMSFAAAILIGFSIRLCCFE